MPSTSASSATIGMLGANKFDLMLDYIAPAPPPEANPDAYRRVRRAMGEMAILDARDAGLTFIRAAVSGFGPSEFGGKDNHLDLWQTNPKVFWTALDRMFDDLDAAGMRLVPTLAWNIRQFPALGHDDIGTFIRNPSSASRRIFSQFIEQFISRYRTRRTILFYETGNEYNLLVDIDDQKDCKESPCIWSNFTTADMNSFANATVALIKSFDPSRPVSSGYALPRPAADHLRRRPQTIAGGADWRPDTEREFQQELVTIHEPFEIMSIHIYPPDATRQSGIEPAARFDPLAAAADAARVSNKQLFVGEFGDPHGAGPFVVQVLGDIVRKSVNYAAVWVWEFYQTSTYQTRNTPATLAEIEPADSKGMIPLIVATEKRLGSASAPNNKKSGPRVVLTWPLPCASIDRPTTLAAVASDGSTPVARVEFLVDGILLASAAAAPYRVQFNPVGLGSRTARITARALTASGSVADFESIVRLNSNNVGSC